MQGYLLPLALAMLLAAPVVWRLGSDVRESPAVLAEGDTSSAAQRLSLTSFTLQDNQLDGSDETLSGPEADSPSSVMQASSTPPALAKTAAGREESPTP